MKKLLFTLLFAVLTTIGFSQTNFKIGVLSSISVDDDFNSDVITLGSVSAGIIHSVSKSFCLTGSLSALKFKNSGEGFWQFPLMAGGRYNFNKSFYFGGEVGASVYNQKYSGVNFLFSPYIGCNVKRISVDLRYLHTVKSNPVQSTVIVLSYTL